jgi:hypothetical protein
VIDYDDDDRYRHTDTGEKSHRMVIDLVDHRINAACIKTYHVSKLVKCELYS